MSIRGEDLRRKARKGEIRIEQENQEESSQWGSESIHMIFLPAKE